MRIIIFLTITLFSLVPLSKVHCEEDGSSKSIFTIVGESRDSNLMPFPNDDSTKKILKRNKFQNEGSALAEQGLYEEAIVKFRLAADPSLIIEEHERAVPIGLIVRAYERQGKFEEALKEQQWFIVRHEKPTETALEEQTKLKALITARDTKNNKSIYEYINYMKKKYSKYLPPNGYLAGETGILIGKFIHLYDYMHDYDAGIALMDEVIKYNTEYNKKHKIVRDKTLSEYTRVKQAWELDKKTGQHGHLQEVIRTSDVISW